MVTKSIVSSYRDLDYPPANKPLVGFDVRRISSQSSLASPKSTAFPVVQWLYNSIVFKYAVGIQTTNNIIHEFGLLNLTSLHAL